MEVLTQIVVYLALVATGILVGWVFGSPFNKAKVKKLLTGRPQLVVLLAGPNPSLDFSVVDKPISTDPIKAKFGKQEMVLTPNPVLNKHVDTVEVAAFDPTDCRQIPMESVVHYKNVVTEEVDERTGERKIVLAGFTNANILGKLVGPSQLETLVNQYFAWVKKKALMDMRNNPIYTWLPWLTAGLAFVGVLAVLYNVSLTNGVSNQVSSMPTWFNATFGVIRP